MMHRFLFYLISSGFLQGAESTQHDMSFMDKLPMLLLGSFDVHFGSGSLQQYLLQYLCLNYYSNV